jgi:hypothetical protein
MHSLRHGAVRSRTVRVKQLRYYPLVDHHQRQMCFGTLVVIATGHSRKVDDLMRIHTSFLAVLLPIGGELLQRANVQGVEPALVSSVVEYGSAGLVRLSTWVRSSRNPKRHG